MMLVQLVAKRPEDREHFARRFVHGCVCVVAVARFGFVDDGIAFPGAFCAGHVTVKGVG